MLVTNGETPIKGVAVFAVVAEHHELHCFPL
jgi:hypothetical protein